MDDGFASIIKIIRDVSRVYMRYMYSQQFPKWLSNVWIELQSIYNFVNEMIVPTTSVIVLYWTIWVNYPIICVLTLNEFIYGILFTQALFCDKRQSC